LRRGGGVWTAGFVGSGFEAIYAFRPKDGQIAATFHRVTPSGLLTGYRENAALFVDMMNERDKPCRVERNTEAAQSREKAKAKERDAVALVDL